MPVVSHAWDINDFKKVIVLHRRYALGLVTYLLEVRWKIYEESDLRETTRKYRVLNVQRWEHDDNGDARVQAGRRKTSEEHKILYRRREERRWNFYNDTFCVRDYFRYVPAGIEWARASASVFRREPAPEMNSRVDSTYFLHFSFLFLCGAKRGLLMWKTWCENLRMKVNYFRLLIIRGATKERVMYKKAAVIILLHSL